MPASINHYTNCTNTPATPALNRGASGRRAHGKRELEPNGAENLQYKFIRNVEHQLRTPLAVMLGYADMLHNGDLGHLTFEQQQATCALVTNAYKLRTLVDRICVLLEIEGHTWLSDAIALNDIVANVVEDKNALVAQAGLKIEAHLAQEAPLVSGSRQHLRQAIDCLLESALRITPPAGRVTVRVYPQAEWICCDVITIGSEIVEEEMATPNGSCQPEKSASCRSDEGKLGLAVARAVAEAHSGQFEAVSHPDLGSRLTIRLPSASAETDAPGTARRESASSRILVVDDEINLALTLQVGLKRQLGCEVIAAHSGEQALQLFRHQAFDLLITDYKMPDMDGMMLAALIRRLYPKTAVIIITAYGSDNLRAQANQAAIYHILDKPVGFAEIRAAAAEALERRA